MVPMKSLVRPFLGDPLPSRRLLVWIVILAGAVRLLAIALWTNFDINTALIWEYGQQAQCAVQTGGDLCRIHDQTPYPSAYMPPLASYYWLVAIKLLGQNLAPAAFIGFSFIASLLSIGLLFELAERVSKSTVAALGAALILAFYPTFVFVTTTYETTNIALAATLSLIWVCRKIALGKDGIGYAALAGVLITICAYLRSEMLLIGAVLVCMAAAWRLPDWRSSLRIAALAGAVSAATLAPWVIRNEMIFGRFVPVAQSHGYNLWKGYSRYAQGSGHWLESNALALEDADRIRTGIAVSQHFEPQMEDAFARSTWADVKAGGPVRIVKLMATKLAMVWVFDWTDPNSHRTAYWIPWIASNALVLAGVIFLMSGKAAVEPVSFSFAVAMLFLLSLIYMLTEMELRYRMHIEPFLFIFAGMGLEGLAGYLAGRLPVATGFGAGLALGRMEGVPLRPQPEEEGQTP